MNYRKNSRTAIAVGISWLMMRVILGPSAGLAQTSAPTPPPVSQTPTFGEHAPQAAGQPSWREGMTSEQANSPLHPNVANMLGHPAKEIPVDRFKVPAGFKIELWAGDLQEARSMALGAKGTVFVSQRTHDAVFAIVDKGDHREVKKILKGLNAPNGVTFANGTLFVASASGSPATTTSRTSSTTRRHRRSSSRGCRIRMGISGSSW